MSGRLCSGPEAPQGWVSSPVLYWVIRPISFYTKQHASCVAKAEEQMMQDSVFDQVQSNPLSPREGLHGITSEMMALRAHQSGGPEGLVVEHAPTPAPASGEVLVAVHAAAITFDELKRPQTWTRDGRSRTPVILSHEVSGVVADIGPEVTDSRAGDDVYGLIGFAHTGPRLRRGPGCGTRGRDHVRRAEMAADVDPRRTQPDSGNPVARSIRRRS